MRIFRHQRYGCAFTGFYVISATETFDWFEDNASATTVTLPHLLPRPAH